MSVYDGAQTVVTSGTRVALNESAGVAPRDMARTILITGNMANLGAIWVGGRTIAVDRGTPILAGDTVTLPPHEMNIYDLAETFLDADNDGEGVTFSYVRR